MSKHRSRIVAAIIAATIFQQPSPSQEPANAAKEITELKKRVADLQLENQRLAKILKKANADRDTMTFRAEDALRELKDLRKRLFMLEYGLEVQQVENEARQPISKKDRTSNPPAQAVKGKVLSTKNNVVQLNVGLDDGVKFHHTLEVFRVEPRQEYLGMIQILKSYPRESFGRMVLGRHRIQMGNLVADKTDLKKEVELTLPISRDPNPPRFRVHGNITKVNAKANAIEIDVGLDGGIKDGHTLEVYRLKPSAEYLGRLLIVDAQARHAVGEMFPLLGKIKTVKPGDRVTDRLDP
jgi:hypothetical protein